MQKSTESKILEKLRETFPTEEVPSAPIINPASERWEETAVFWGKTWDELRVDDFERNPFCFSFFGDQFFSYFFGGIMYRSILEGRYQIEAYDLLFSPWASSHLTEFVDGLDVSFLGKRIREIRCCLNTVQLEVFSDYLVFRSKFVDEDQTKDANLFLSALRGSS